MLVETHRLQKETRRIVDKAELIQYFNIADPTPTLVIYDAAGSDCLQIKEQCC